MLCEFNKFGTFIWKKKQSKFFQFAKLMIKPSRFKNEKIQLSIESHSKFLATRLGDRFMFSRALVQEGDVNFHIGVDILQKKEVIVLSSLPTKYSFLNCQEQLFLNISPKITWQGFHRIKRVLYQFQVLEKNGIFLREFIVSLGQKSVKNFYKILILMVELIIKLQGIRATKIDLNIDTIQVIFENESKKVHLQISNRNIYEIQKQQIVSSFKKYSRHQVSPNGAKKNRQTSFFLQKKTNNKHELRILFEKIIEIQKLFNKTAEQNKDKMEQEKISFSEEMRKILAFIEESSLNKDTLEAWNFSVSQVLKKDHHLKVEKLKQEIRGLAETLKNEKIEKIKACWESLVSDSINVTMGSQSQQELSDWVQQEEDEDEDEEECRSGKIEDRVTNHKLVTKLGNPSLSRQ